MTAYVYRNLQGRMVTDPRVDEVPLRLKHTHVMSRAGFRVHRIRRAHALHPEYARDGEYRVSMTGACGISLLDHGRLILGTAESLIAAGGVLCPFCHKCRCAYPCERQCVCSTRCRQCQPNTAGECRFTAQQERSA